VTRIGDVGNTVRHSDISFPLSPRDHFPPARVTAQIGQEGRKRMSLGHDVSRLPTYAHQPKREFPQVRGSGLNPDGATSRAAYSNVDVRREARTLILIHVPATGQ
jgi:hypothetical protein